MSDAYDAIAIVSLEVGERVGAALARVCLDGQASVGSCALAVDDQVVVRGDEVCVAGDAEEWIAA